MLVKSSFCTTNTAMGQHGFMTTTSLSSRQISVIVICSIVDVVDTLYCCCWFLFIADIYLWLFSNCTNT